MMEAAAEPKKKPSKIQTGCGCLVMITVAIIVLAIVFGPNGADHTKTTSPAVPASSERPAHAANSAKYPLMVRVPQPTPPQGLSRYQLKYWTEGASKLRTFYYAEDAAEAAEVEDAKRFVEEYVNAYAGDYLAQANVSYDLGNEPYLQTSHVAACAWRVVMADGGSAYYRDTDTQRHDQICGPLPGTSMTAATAQAHRIEGIIRAGHVARIAVPEIDFDPARSADEGGE